MVGRLTVLFVVLCAWVFVGCEVLIRVSDGNPVMAMTGVIVSFVIDGVIIYTSYKNHKNPKFQV